MTPIDHDIIRFEETTVNLSKKALADLYVSVGFGKQENYKDCDDMVEGMFGPGVFGIFAFDNGALIGLARVLSDDYLVAWIAEIVVHPDWQNNGI